MPTAVGPNTKGEENLIFGFDLGDGVNSYPGVPAVNCAPVPTSKGSWSVTEITDGSIVPPRKGARVFKFVAGSTSNLYRHSGYYGGGGFSNNNNINPLILGRTSPSNFTTVSQANKYRWGFWVRGVSTNTAGWSFYIDIGDLGGAASKSYTVGNNIDWYFIDVLGQGTNSNGYPYDFFDIFSSNQGLTMYVSDMGIMRAPGTVDSLPDIQAYPQWVDYGQERTYTEGLKDLTGNSTIDLTNVSFDSDAQMTFDGTDDYIDLGDLGLGAGPFTVAAVIYPTLASTYHVFFRKGDDSTSNDNMDWSMGYDYNQFHVRAAGASVSVNEYAGGSFINSNGYVALTYDGVTMRMYKNGSEVLNKTVTFGNSYSNYSIGRGINNYADITVKSLSVYNRALSVQEILSNYNALKGRYNI